jgi:hypothetical protein
MVQKYCFKQKFELGVSIFRFNLFVNYFDGKNGGCECKIRYSERYLLYS